MTTFDQHLWSNYLVPVTVDPRADLARNPKVVLNNNGNLWKLIHFGSNKLLTGNTKAILLNPNHAMSHASYSSLLGMLGRHEEAMEQIKIALDIDPLNPLIIAFYGGALTN